MNTIDRPLSVWIAQILLVVIMLLLLFTLLMDIATVTNRWTGVLTGRDVSHQPGCGFEVSALNEIAAARSNLTFGCHV